MPISWTCSCGAESGKTWPSYRWNCAARNASLHVRENGFTGHEAKVDVVEVQA